MQFYLIAPYLSMHANEETPPQNTVTMSVKDRSDYVMKHFLFIADQRIKTFNFYIILLAATSGASISAVQKGLEFHILLTCGVLNIAVAVIFWIMDKRSRLLLSLSKNAMKSLEQLPEWPNECKLFIADADLMSDPKMYKWTFTRAFRLAYGLQIFLGICLLLCSVYMPKKQSVTQKQAQTIPAQSLTNYTQTNSSPAEPKP